PAWMPLRKAAASSPDLETRRRARHLVQAIGGREFVELRRFTGHTDRVDRVAVSPDGRHALSGSWGDQKDRTVRLWDVARAQEVRRLEGHTGAITCVAYSPDGKRALSGSLDRTVRLWDLDGGKELRCLKGHTQSIANVVFSPDGKQAVSAA